MRKEEEEEEELGQQYQQLDPLTKCKTKQLDPLA